MQHKLDIELFQNSDGLTKLVSDYPTNRKTNCSFFCNIFKYTFSSSFAYMKSRNSYISPKLRLEREARQAVQKKFGNLLLIPESCRIKSRQHEIQVHCTHCRRKHQTTIFNILQSKYGCKLCGIDAKATTQKKNNGNEQKFVEALKAKGWTLLGAYKSVSTPCLVSCSNAHENTVIPKAFMSYEETVCNECLVERQHALADERCKKIKWTRKSSYTGRHDQMKFECDRGHPVSMRFGDFIGDKEVGCRKCSGVCPEDAKNRFYENLEALNLTAIGQYAGTKQQVKCYRKPCKHEVLVTPIYLAQGCYNECDDCNSESLMQKFTKALAEGGFSLHNHVEKASDLAEITCRLNHARKAPMRDIAEGRQCLECSRMSHSLASLLSHDEVFLYNKVRGLYFVPFTHKGKVKYKRGVCSERGIKARHPTTYQTDDGIRILDYSNVKYMSNFNALLTELFIGIYFRDSAIDMQGVLQKCKGGSECHNLNILDHYSLSQLELLARMHISEVVKFALQGT